MELQSVIGFCLHLLGYDPLEGPLLTGKSDLELAKILTELLIELKSSDTAQQKFQPTEDNPSFGKMVTNLEQFARSFDLLQITDMFRESLVKGEDDNLTRDFDRIRQHEELVSEAQNALTEVNRNDDNKEKLAKLIPQLQSFIDRNKPLTFEKQELILRQRGLKSGERKESIKARVAEIEKLTATGLIDCLYLTFEIQDLIKNEPPVVNKSSVHRATWLHLGDDL